MKKTTKIFVSCLLVLTMIFSVGMVAFAEKSAALSSQVEFIAVDGSVYAEAFVRDYSQNPKNAVLILAVYGDGNTLESALKSDEAQNNILRVGPVAMSEGKTLKAFVWEAASMNIISNVAVCGAAEAEFDAALEGIEITVDGKSFKEYFGEDFSKDKFTYSKDLSEYNEVTLPAYKVTSLNNALSTKVVTDVEALKTEITVEFGAGVKKEESFIYDFEQKQKTDANGNLIYKDANGKETTTVTETLVMVDDFEKPIYSNTKKTTYEKPFSKTYTISYKIKESDPGTIYESDLTVNSASNYASNATFAFEYKKSFDKGTENAPELIEVPLKYSNQGQIVVVQPAAGYTGKVELGEIIVKPVFDEDGTTVIGSEKYVEGTTKGSIQEDVELVTNYNPETGEKTTARKVVGAGTLTYKANATDTTEKVINVGTDAKGSNGVWLMENFHKIGANNNLYDQGARLLTDRNPFSSKAKTVYNYKDEALTGGLYFALPSNPGNSSYVDEKLSFYVNTPVDVYILSAKAISVEGWNSVSTTNSCFVRYQDNVIKELDAAYMIAKGMLVPGDLLGTIGAGAYRSHKYIEPLYGRDAIKVKDTAKAALVEGKSYVEILELLDFDFNGNAVVTDGSDLITEPVVADAYKNKVPTVKRFGVTPCYSTSGKLMDSYRVYNDRPYDAMPHNGLIASCNDTLGLYGATHISHPLGWANDVEANAYAAAYKQKAKEKIYSFTLKADAEIIVLTQSGNNLKAYAEYIPETDEFYGQWKVSENNRGYVSVAQSGTDALSAFVRMSSLKAEKGDEITIYSPGTSTSYIVLVKPIN